MTPEEFEKMCRSINDSVAKVGESVGKAAIPVGKGLGDIGSSIGSIVSSALSSAAAEQERKAAERKAEIARVRHEAIMRTRFKDPAKCRSGAVTKIVFGAIGSFIFCGSAITGLSQMLAMGVAFTSLISFGLLAVLGGASVGLLVSGIKQSQQATRLRYFERIFGDREVVNTSELAAQTGLPPASVLKSARAMIGNGMLPNGHIANDGSCVMVTPESYQLYVKLGEMKKQLAAEKREQEAAAPSHTPDSQLPPEARDFIEKGNGYLTQLRALDDAIDDEGLSQSIVAIEDVVRRILDRVAADPSVLSCLDNLMGYYLPTTVKLLEAYDQLEEQPIQGENIMKSRTEIEQTLTGLISAYERLLDSTFRDMTLDVSSDISVLQTLLAQDGLTANPFDTAGGQGAGQGGPASGGSTSPDTVGGQGGGPSAVADAGTAADTGADSITLKL